MTRPMKLPFARFVILVTVTLIVATLAPVLAQQNSAEEKQIRDLIAADDSGKTAPTTQDSVFWSGAYKRPFVRGEKSEEVPGPGQPANRVPGSDRRKTTVRRIEVAKSGDLAYEFSDARLSYELKTGARESFPLSLLRVWRKESGQWRIAAQFMHPHEK